MSNVLKAMQAGYAATDPRARQIQNARTRLEAVGVDPGEPKESAFVRILHALGWPSRQMGSALGQLTGHGGENVKEAVQFFLEGEGLVSENPMFSMEIPWFGKDPQTGQRNSMTFAPTPGGTLGLAADMLNPLDPLNRIRFGMGTPSAAKGVTGMGDDAVKALKMHITNPLNRAKPLATMEPGALLGGFRPAVSKKLVKGAEAYTKSNVGQAIQRRFGTGMAEGMMPRQLRDIEPGYETLRQSTRTMRELRGADDAVVKWMENLEGIYDTMVAPGQTLSAKQAARHLADQSQVITNMNRQLQDIFAGDISRILDGFDDNTQRQIMQIMADRTGELWKAADYDVVRAANELSTTFDRGHNMILHRAKEIDLALGDSMAKNAPFVDGYVPRHMLRPLNEADRAALGLPQLTAGELNKMPVDDIHKALTRRHTGLGARSMFLDVADPSEINAMFKAVGLEPIYEEGLLKIASRHVRGQVDALVQMDMMDGFVRQYSLDINRAGEYMRQNPELMKHHGVYGMRPLRKGKGYELVRATDSDAVLERLVAEAPSTFGPGAAKGGAVGVGDMTDDVAQAISKKRTAGSMSHYYALDGAEGGMTNAQFDALAQRIHAEAKAAGLSVADSGIAKNAAEVRELIVYDPARVSRLLKKHKVSGLTPEEFMNQAATEQFAKGTLKEEAITAIYRGTPTQRLPGSPRPTQPRTPAPELPMSTQYSKSPDTVLSGVQWKDIQKGRFVEWREKGHEFVGEVVGSAKKGSDLNVYVQVGGATGETRRLLLRDVDRIVIPGQSIERTVREGTPNLVKAIEKPLRGNQLVLPDEMANYINLFNRALQEPEWAADGIMKLYKSYIQAFKSYTTVPLPGYWLRNKLGDFQLMFLADTNPASMVEGFKLLQDPAAYKVLVNGKMISGQELMSYAGVMGLPEGLAAAIGDASSAAKFAAKDVAVGTGRSGARQLFDPKNPIGMMETAGRKWVDSHSRYSMLLDRLQKGDSLLDGVAFVKKHLFSYSDLTPFEKTTMRHIFPFYSWMRKNIPHQVEMLLTKPGKFTTMQKLRSGFSQEDPDATEMPSFLRRSLGMSVGSASQESGRSFISARLPDEDLGRFGLGELLGAMAAPLRLPFEIATNQNIATGVPIRDRGETFLNSVLPYMAYQSAPRLATSLFDTAQMLAGVDLPWMGAERAGRRMSTVMSPFGIYPGDRAMRGGQYEELERLLDLMKRMEMRGQKVPTLQELGLLKGR